MEDDEDDFFAYQTAKSLNNKRTQLKRYLQTANVCKNQSSDSSDVNSDDGNDLIERKPIKPATIQSVVTSSEPIKAKNTIQSEIDAIVTSCFTSTHKENKRKIKLGKRTAADDLEEENEDEYLNQLIHHHNRQGRRNRTIPDALNKSQFEEDEEKVTRETAAYDRLDAVLRVTKPLCEKQFGFSDEDDNEPINETDTADAIHSIVVDTVTLKIDHSDGRQFTLSLSSSTTLKELYDQVAERLSVPSIYLVHNNQTLKLDDDNRLMTLKELNFSSDHIQTIESYPLMRKIKVFIQTSKTSSSASRSSLLSKREYTMLDTDRFETIFNQYKRDVKSNNVRFEFDGDRLHPDATPIDYDMIDEEILDAFISSVATTKN